MMLSYSRGPDEGLWELTIGQVLDQTVDRCGDGLALVSRHQSKRHSWRELRDLADCVAQGGSDPGECQSGLPHARSGLHSAQVAHEGALPVGA